MQSLAYEIIKFLLYILVILSGFVTIVTPTFFNDKMAKSPSNYISGLSLKKRLSILTRIGWLFIGCAIISILLSFTLAKLDSIESSYEQKKEQQKQISTIDSLNSVRLATQDLINNERLESKDREQILRDSLSDVQNKNQVKHVEDSVRSVKLLLNAKSFQYDALSAELKLANQEKLMLEKEFNSPRIDFSSNVSVNPEFKLDSANDRLIFTVYITNKGKGAAINVHFSFCLIHDNNSNLSFLYKTNGQHSKTFDTIDENETTGPMLFLSRDLGKSGGIYYVALEITYTDILKKQRIPFRKVFNIKNCNIEKPLPIISNNDFDVVSDFLVKNGIWNKI